MTHDNARNLQHEYLYQDPTSCHMAVHEIPNKTRVSRTQTTFHMAVHEIIKTRTCHAIQLHELYPPHLILPDIRFLAIP